MKGMNPRVGVASLIINKDKILIGKRKSSLGGGTWGPPGGHLEFGESFEECARRETKEEADINIKDVNFLIATNDIYEGKHYVTIVMISKYESGEVTLTDSDEHYEWIWSSIQDLPENLFFPFENFLKTHKDLVQEMFGKI